MMFSFLYNPVIGFMLGVIFMVIIMELIREDYRAWKRAHK